MPSTAASPLEHPALTRALRDVASRVQSETDGTDGVGATVLVGDRSVFGGSNAFTTSIDVVQYGLHEGPCLLAVQQNRSVRSARIGSGESRWPNFTPPAASLGLRSVTSTPIVANDEVIGSLNLYSRRPNGLAGLDPGALRQSARAAERAVGEARLLALVEASAWALAESLRDAADVDLAIGLLMARYRMTAGQSRTLIVQLARQDQVGVASAARSLTAQAGPR